MNPYDERYGGNRRNGERDRGTWSSEWRGEAHARPAREDASFSERKISRQGEPGRSGRTGYESEGYGNQERYGSSPERYGSPEGLSGQDDARYTERGSGQRDFRSQHRQYGDESDEDRYAGEQGRHGRAERYGQQRHGQQQSASGQYGSSGYGSSRYGEEDRGERGFDYGRARWGAEERGSRFSEDEYSLPSSREQRESRYGGGYGRSGYGGGGYRSSSNDRSSEDWRSPGEWSERESYGSGMDRRMEGRMREQRRFGEERRFGERGPFADTSDSPGYFGTGYYGDGGSQYTGGFDPRERSRDVLTYGGGGSRYPEDSGRDWRASGRDWSGSEGFGRGSWGDESRSEAWRSEPWRDEDWRGGDLGRYGGGGQRWDNRGYGGSGREQSAGFMGRAMGRHRTGPKGYTRSDERLREDISERLMMADHIDSSEVTVNVKDGKVTLEGSVPSRYMKHAIEDLVDLCPGVQDIDNQLRVERDPSRLEGGRSETQPTQGTMQSSMQTPGGTKQSQSQQGAGQQGVQGSGQRATGSGGSGGATTGPGTTTGLGGVGTSSMGTGAASSTTGTGAGSERERSRKQ